MAFYSVCILGFFFSLIVVPIVTTKSGGEGDSRSVLKKSPHHFLKG